MTGRLTMTEAAKRTGFSRAHFYRLIDPGATCFVPPLAEIIHTDPRTGRQYVNAAELDALYGSAPSHAWVHAS